MSSLIHMDVIWSFFTKKFLMCQKFPEVSDFANCFRSEISNIRDQYIIGGGGVGGVRYYFHTVSYLFDFSCLIWQQPVIIIHKKRVSNMDIQYQIKLLKHYKEVFITLIQSIASLPFKN